MFPDGVPKRISVGCPRKPKGILILSLAIHKKVCTASSVCRKVYFPSKRSKSVRVSVRTEFSAANEKPIDYVGYQFPVLVVQQEYATYITVTLRRNHERKKK